MLHELVAVVHFDDSGALLERPAHTATAALPNSADSLISSSSGSSNGRASASTSHAPVPRGVPASLSFESFLAVPRDFLARHALHSATEATLLLDITRLAVEMDVVAECALEQLQDRAELSRALTAGDAAAATASASASLATTLLVLLRQATATNTQSLVALVERLASCVDQLNQLRYPLAQCIESNHRSARELAPSNPALAQSRRALAEVEVALLHRLDAFEQPFPRFRMTPLNVPQWRPADVPSEAGTPQRSWSLSLGSSSLSAPSPSHASSSTTQSDTSLRLSATPSRQATTPPRDPARESSSSSHSNGSSSTARNGSSDSNRQHSQPLL